MIDFEHKQIQYYDSQHGAAGPFFRHLRGWLGTVTTALRPDDLAGKKQCNRVMLLATEEVEIWDSKPGQR